MKYLNFKCMGAVLIATALATLATVAFAALPMNGGKATLNRALLAALDKQQIVAVQLLVKGGASKLDIDLALRQRLPPSANKDGVDVDDKMFDALAKLGLADTNAMVLSAVKSSDSNLLKYFLDRDKADNDEFELGLELKNKLWPTLVENWDDEVFSPLLQWRDAVFSSLSQEQWRTPTQDKPVQNDGLYEALYGGLDEALLTATNKNNAHVARNLVRAIAGQTGLATALQVASRSGNGEIIGIVLLALFSDIDNPDQMSEVVNSAQDAVRQINTDEHRADILNAALSEIFKGADDYSFEEFHFETIKFLVEEGATSFNAELRKHLLWLSQHSSGYGEGEWLLGKLIELKVADPSVVVQAVIEARDTGLLYFLVEHSDQLKEATKNLVVEFVENWKPDALEFILILPFVEKEIETEVFDRALAKAIDKNNMALVKSIISSDLASDDALRAALNQAKISGNWEIINLIEEVTYLGNTGDENFDWESPNDEDYPY